MKTQEELIKLTFDDFARNQVAPPFTNISRSYKKIIEYVSNSTFNRTAKFKILPKKSNFIIGSDSSKSRGEVILFDND